MFIPHYPIIHVLCASLSLKPPPNILNSALFCLCGIARGLIVPQPATARGVAAVISVSADGKFLIYTNGNNVIVRSVEVRWEMPRWPRVGDTFR